MMSDLLMEADEALKQERIFKFWHEHGKSIIAFMVMTVIATGALSAYRSWDKNVRSQQTTQILDLLDQEDFAQSLNPNELDVRDGLKPVHRRILYAQSELSTTGTGRIKNRHGLLGALWVNITRTGIARFTWHW